MLTERVSNEERTEGRPLLVKRSRGDLERILEGVTDAVMENNTEFPVGGTFPVPSAAKRSKKIRIRQLIRYRQGQ